MKLEDIALNADMSLELRMGRNKNRKKRGVSG